MFTIKLTCVEWASIGWAICYWLRLCSVIKCLNIEARNLKSVWGEYKGLVMRENDSSSVIK